MARALLALAVWLALGRPVQAQGQPGCCGYGMGPLSGAPLVDIEGKIARVRITPGQGMPSIVLETRNGEVAVLLGPVWYLMAQNFNPKVGDDAAAKAYKTANGLIAASVSLPQGKKTIRLRDTDGNPLWRGRRW